VRRNEIRLFAWELESMGEYSSTLPTGQTIWKQWRCRALDEPSGWVVGQYVPSLDPKYVGIRWYRVVLKHGPRPPLYSPPDWDRYCYYKRGGFDHGIGYTRATT
jgi:hypothetical protein